MGLMDRENAVISSFLFANDTFENLDNVFIMDESIFSTKLQKRVVAKINEETNGSKMYGYQSIVIENAIEGTGLVVEWINILAQTPLPLTVASRIYKDLVKENNQRIARGLVC